LVLLATSSCDTVSINLTYHNQFVESLFGHLPIFLYSCMRLSSEGYDKKFPGKLMWPSTISCPSITTEELFAATILYNI
jgi:hypothetical protein